MGARVTIGYTAGCAGGENRPPLLSGDGFSRLARSGCTALAGPGAVCS